MRQKSEHSYIACTRGAFLVSSAIEKGKINFVQIRSQAGGECRLRNAWNNADVTLYRDGIKHEDISGDILRFSTKKGETTVIVPRDSEPSSIRIL